MVVNTTKQPPLLLKICLRGLQHYIQSRSQTGFLCKTLTIYISKMSNSHWLTDFTTPHLKGLDECPEQGANALPSAEELDQTHDSKQTEEGDGDASAVLRVLRRINAESEDRRVMVYVVKTEHLAVLYGMMRSEVRPQSQIHMGWDSSTASLHLHV